ncbi:MAG: polyhydroxybutyrate depolymerase [Pseudomonadota bacterium]
MRLSWCLGVVLTCGSVGAQDCGAPELGCETAGGIYHVAVPDTDRPPMVLYLHGYGGSGASAVRNQGFARRFTDRGYALVSPSGQIDPDERFRRDWDVDDGYPMPRDDVSFLSAVITDAARRFDLDGERVLVTGFSRGGSMVWDFACAAPEAATAFAAVAGGFWEPIQPDCAGPTHLHHSHGFTDPMVPLEGRAVHFEGIDFVQGNILKGLDTWRRENGCEGRADDSLIEGEVWEKRWTACAAGSLTLRLTPGGHGLPDGWTGLVLDWFEALPDAG